MDTASEQSFSVKKRNGMRVLQRNEKLPELNKKVDHSRINPCTYIINMYSIYRNFIQKNMSTE